MSAAQLMHDLASTPGWFVGLSVEQYHQMIENGILEEGAPIELLDGFLVRKDRHTIAQRFAAKHCAGA